MSQSHPANAVEALFALHNDAVFDRTKVTTVTECSSPSRTTKDTNEDSTPPLASKDSGLTPTKFTLSGVKRKGSCDLELVYETSSTQIRVPFKKGESESVLHRRRNTMAQIALEQHLRVTAMCMWSKTVVSFRFNPDEWTLIHDTNQQQQYVFGSAHQIRLVVTRQTCSASGLPRSEMCRNCAHPHWRVCCLKPSFVRHISSVTALSRPCDCDKTMAQLGLLSIDGSDMKPFLKRVPSQCNDRN